jgi:O-antigen/teichoic acid export membrane protein
LLRSLLILSPLTALTLAASIVQGKVVAELLGPEGSGRFFLAASFFAFATTVGAIGIHSAMTKLVSEFRTRSPGLVWETVLLGLFTVTATSVLLVGIAAVSGATLSEALLGGLEPSADRRFVVVITAVALVPAGWSLTMLGFLRGLGVLKAYSLAGSIMTGVTVTAIVCGCAVGGFRGAFVGAVLAQAIGVAVMGFFATTRATNAGMNFSLSFQRPYLLGRRILTLGGLALVAALAGALGHLVVRAFIAQSIDLRAVGFFAAAWSITNRLPSLVYQTFSSYLAPEISSLGREWKRISEEQNHALRFVLVAGTPVLCTIVVAAPIAIRALLSPEFLPMTDLLRIMLCGELVSMIYWATAMALYPSGRALANAACEWAWWVIFGILVIVFTERSGLIGAGYAYVLSYGLLAAALYVSEARRGRLRWSTENKQLLLVSMMTLLTITIVATEVTESTITLILMLTGSLLAWPRIALTRSERTIILQSLSRWTRFGS